MVVEQTLTRGDDGNHYFLVPPLCQVVPKATHLLVVKPIVTNLREAWCSSLQSGGSGT